MTHLTFTNNGKTYRQITKRTAKRLYCEGKTIYMCPANIRPFNSNAFKVCYGTLGERERKRTKPKNAFELLTNLCVYHNCNNETGRYLRFYAEF